MAEALDATTETAVESKDSTDASKTKTDEEGDYAPVPTDKASDTILIVFLLWTLLVAPVHYLTCRVERYPVPAIDSLINKTVVFPVNLHMHCIASEASLCSQYFEMMQFEGTNNPYKSLFANSNLLPGSQASDLNLGIYAWRVNIKTHFQDIKVLSKQCQTFSISPTTSEYSFCFDSIVPSDSGHLRGSYSFFTILVPSDASEAPSSWVAGPFRSSWRILSSSNFASLAAQEQNALKSLLSASLLSMPSLQARHRSDDTQISAFNQIFSLTLLNSNPRRGYMFKWNMSDVYEGYLSSFLSKIDNVLIYDPIVDAEVLYYGHIIGRAPTDRIVGDQGKDRENNNNHINVNFDAYVQRTRTRNGNEEYFYLTDRHLKTFVGSTDWSRVSTISRDNAHANINFIVYIPPHQYTPLFLHSDDSSDSSDRSDASRHSAFIVPKFGGVTIFNPAVSDSATGETISMDGPKVRVVGAQELQKQMSLIVSQLRIMFGLENDKFDERTGRHDEVLWLFDAESGINDWEVDLLVRDLVVRDLNQIYEALENIHKIMDSVDQLPIHLKVSQRIGDAVEAFDKGVQLCAQGQYDECVAWTRYGSHMAHKAEFDESMLPALYFSSEFTYAVYSPYFLPGYIPIFAALVKRVREYRKKRKEAKDALEKKKNE